MGGVALVLRNISKFFGLREAKPGGLQIKNKASSQLGLGPGLVKLLGKKYYLTVPLPPKVLRTVQRGRGGLGKATLTIGSRVDGLYSTFSILKTTKYSIKQLRFLILLTFNQFVQKRN